MACTLPWVMREGPTYSKNVPTLPRQVGGGGSNMKCGQKNTRKYNFYISGPNVLNFEFVYFLFYFFLIILVDFSCLCKAVVKLKALPQRLHTYFFAVPLCTFLCCRSAASMVYFFGHSLHLKFFSAYGIWGQIYPFCPGKWEYVSAGFVCCKMSLHTWNTPRGSTGHGPPACTTRPCTACHSQMGGH